jgi:hypothetical protein
MDMNGNFTPDTQAHKTHWIAGWVGFRVGLDVEAKRKITAPASL